jgi:outer membrane protein assembly factor BamE (lipoprotein component of BamABCDE complex)
MRRSMPLFAVLLLLLPGCILGRVRDEEPIDEDKVAKIVPGQTTKRQVCDLLGAPTYVNDRIGLKVLGRPVQAAGDTGPLIDELIHSPLDHSYTYEYTETKSFSLYLVIVSFTNQETKRDRVVVFFDDKGLVSHVGATFNAKDASFRMPTSD